MVDALIVSNVLLWILVVVLAGVVVALVRQIGVLHERVAPSGALAIRGGPQVGAAAPRLELVAADGCALRVGGEAEDGRSTLLFFASASCGVCAELLPVLASVAGAEARWLRCLVAGDGSASERAKLLEAHDLAARDLVWGPEAGLAFRVAQLPYAVLVDSAGIVRAAGLVNTREHIESLFEAQEAGVASIQDYLERSDRRAASGEGS